MFQFCAIRPHGSHDGAGLLPDFTGPGVEDLVPDPGDGTMRHTARISGFTVTVDGTAMVGAQQRAGWLLATEARLVFCVPSYIAPSLARPLNGITGAAVRLTNRHRAKRREAGTVYAGQVRWEHLAGVAASRPANPRVWDTEPDLLVVEAAEAITSRSHPRHVRIAWSAAADTGDVHALAGWLAQTAAHRRLAGGVVDAPTREALAVLAAGAPVPVHRDEDGGATVSYSVPGAAVATWPPTAAPSSGGPPL